MRIGFRVMHVPVRGSDMTCVQAHKSVNDVLPWYKHHKD
jgi:hypothetical protein